MASASIADRFGLEFSASILTREIAAADPRRVFVEDSRRTVTYGDFNQASDRVAAGLLDVAGRGEHRVLLRVGSYEGTAIALMGTWRAGMVPVLQDLTVPRSRIEIILEDLDASMVLSEIPADNYPGLATEDPRTFGREPREGELPISPASIATIAYTSGSTGEPKGIVQPTVREVSKQMDGVLAGIEQPRLAWLGATAWATFFVHSSCGRIVLPYDIQTRGIVGLGAWIRENRISALVTVPTVLRALLTTLTATDTFPDLRAVALSGESLLWDDVAQLRSHLGPGGLVLNAFGLTETGVIAMNAITQETEIGQGAVPPGWVVPGVSVEIMREDGAPAAVGESGEIVIESASCAVGYWRRPELTAATFTALPNGRRRIRTGDGGRLLEDGSLEHFGRIDHVVKISGYRVELGEVEAALRSIKGVSDAAATTYSDSAGDTRLIAFVAGPGNSHTTATELRAVLTEALPLYMVPDRIGWLEELPRLPNGKVDRQSLGGDAPDETDPSGDRLPATAATGIQDILCELWAQTLSLAAVEADGNFFELGGDSIRAARLFVAIEQRLGLDRPISLLVEHPTPSRLAIALDEADSAWECLIHIHPEGSRPPLIVVHDGAGEVMFARRLSQELGPDQPVYGLRSAALNGHPITYTSLEEMASTYMALIREAVPHGPYCLYGASFGGAVAFEVALQLQAEGEEVRFIAMGDSPSPRHVANTAESPPVQRPGRVGRLNSTLRSAGIKGVRDALTTRREWQERQRERDRQSAIFASDGPIPLHLRGEFAVQQHGRLMQGYIPTARFDGELILLRAARDEGQKDLGWSEFCSLSVQVVDVHCEHKMLGKEEGLPEVVPHLATRLSAYAAPVAGRR